MFPPNGVFGHEAFTALLPSDSKTQSSQILTKMGEIKLGIDVLPCGLSLLIFI
jgi:hypothetical protein